MNNKKGAMATEYILLVILVILVTIFAMQIASNKYNKVNQNLADVYTSDNYNNVSTSDKAENILKTSEETTVALEKLNGGSQYSEKAHTFSDEIEFNENKPVVIINGEKYSDVGIEGNSIYLSTTGYAGESFEGVCSLNKMEKTDNGIISSQITITNCGEEIVKGVRIYFKGDGIENKGNVIYQLTVSGSFSQGDDNVDFKDIQW